MPDRLRREGISQEGGKRVARAPEQKCERQPFHRALHARASRHVFHSLPFCKFLKIPF